MRFFFCLFYLLMYSQLVAQYHPSCDGARYRSNIFDAVQSTKALKFGEGTTISGNFQELYLDLYEPVGDTETARPAIILAFGGSYIGGERGDLDWLCEAYAKKGYVTVTMDYRLYDGPLFPVPTAEQITEVVIKSVSDMKAAIRYLKEDAATSNLYRIDPDYIFLGGISAGSITAAHTAVIDSTDTFTPELWSTIQSNGGVEGNSSDNLEFDTDIRGFVNFSGGLNDASWIDAEDPPFVSVHDEFDNTVPYADGYATIFGFEIIYMEGSSLLKEKADSAGVQNQLRTIEGSNGHVSYFFGSQQTTQETIDYSAEFLYDLICGDFVFVKQEPEALPIEVFPNPGTGLFYLKQESPTELKVSLFNLLGQKLAQWEIRDQINLSDFENGIYLLAIEDKSSNQRSVKRIIIEK